MNIKIGRDTIKKWIELYYQKYYEMDVKVRIGVSKERVGIYETMSAVVNIVATGEMEICGIKQKVQIPIYENDMKKICESILGEQNLELQRFSYDSGLSSQVVGYGMGETIEEKAYFNGIDLVVNNPKLERERKK